MLRIVRIHIYVQGRNYYNYLEVAVVVILLVYFIIYIFLICHWQSTDESSLSLGERSPDCLNESLKSNSNGVYMKQNVALTISNTHIYIQTHTNSEILVWVRHRYVWGSLRRYKTIVDNNKKTGSGASSWVFSSVQDFLADDSSVEPVQTVSSFAGDNLLSFDIFTWHVLGISTTDELSVVWSSEGKCFLHAFLKSYTLDLSCKLLFTHSVMSWNHVIYHITNHDGYKVASISPSTFTG